MIITKERPKYLMQTIHSHIPTGINASVPLTILSDDKINLYRK